MQIPKSSERTLNYIRLSMVAALAVVAILIANVCFQSLREPSIQYKVQPSSEQNGPQVQIFSGDLGGNVPAGRCTSDVFYTSLPAKCRGADGKLIQVNELPLNLMVIQKDK